MPCTLSLHSHRPWYHHLLSNTHRPQGPPTPRTSALLIFTENYQYLTIPIVHGGMDWWILAESGCFCTNQLQAFAHVLAQVHQSLNKRKVTSDWPVVVTTPLICPLLSSGWERRAVIILWSSNLYQFIWQEKGLFRFFIAIGWLVGNQSFYFVKVDSSNMCFKASGHCFHGYTDSTVYIIHVNCFIVDSCSETRRCVSHPTKSSNFMSKLAIVYTF